MQPRLLLPFAPDWAQNGSAIPLPPPPTRSVRPSLRSVECTQVLLERWQVASGLLAFSPSLPDRVGAMRLACGCQLLRPMGSVKSQRCRVRVLTLHADMQTGRSAWLHPVLLHPVLQTARRQQPTFKDEFTAVTQLVVVVGCKLTLRTVKKTYHRSCKCECKCRCESLAQATSFLDCVSSPSNVLVSTSHV